MELKILPSHLKYGFLEANNTLLVTIAAGQLEYFVKIIIELLRKYIKDVGRTKGDIVDIPQGVCTHQIQVDTEHKQCGASEKIKPFDARGGQKGNHQLS